MKVDLINGRLGIHRFHPMLVHFPSALYPFSFVMDILFYFERNENYYAAGNYSLMGAVGVSVVAIVYGAIDFIKIEPQEQAKSKAGVHALLNCLWFIVYTILLLYQIKYESGAVGIAYLIIMGISIAGLFFSNYLGADLIIRYEIGIDRRKE